MFIIKQDATQCIQCCVYIECTKIKYTISQDEYMYHCAPQGFAYLTFQLDDLADSSPQLIMYFSTSYFLFCSFFISSFFESYSSI